MREQQHVERYDKDGLDEFIEEDVGDGMGGYAKEEVKGMGGMGGLGGGISESMLQDHINIFGTDFMDFMGNDKDNKDTDGMYGYDDDDDDDDDDNGKRWRKVS